MIDIKAFFYYLKGIFDATKISDVNIAQILTAETNENTILKLTGVWRKYEKYSEVFDKIQRILDVLPCCIIKDLTVTEKYNREWELSVEIRNINIEEFVIKINNG